MKKKFLTLFLICLLSLCFSACGSSGSSGQDEYTISVKKGLFNTQISIPKVFTTSSDVEDSGQDSFDIATVAKEQGIKKVTTNDDGSVSMKMSNNTYKSFLTNVKIAIDDYNDAFIKENSDTCSFREAAHDVNLTEFNIKVDSKEYTSSDILSAKPLYFFGTLYQALSDIDREDIKTTVNILDKDTENLIHTDSLTFEQYIEILEGKTELSTEEQEPVTTTASEKTTKDSTSDSTDTSAKSTKTNSAQPTATTTATTQATTIASTQATTATNIATTTTTATTAATTAGSTPNLNTADQSKTTAGATTASTTATTARRSDTGSGSISLVGEESGTSTISSGQNNLILRTTNLDSSHQSYIYIDGMLAAGPVSLETEQVLQLQSTYMTTGTHKVEVIQYNNNNTSNSIVTYKTASYQVN